MSAAEHSPRASAAAAAAGREPAEVLLGERADEVFAALADRTRRRILVHVADRPDDAGAIARDLEISRQAAAKHLRILETAGLVGASRQSRRRVHEVDPARLQEISELLAVVASGWERRLSRIRDRAEGRHDGSGAGRG